MKHLRKISALVIALIMVASIAIGIGVIFSVRNINVALQSYADGDGNGNVREAVKQEVLSSCKGRMISAVSEVDVINCLGEGYTLESFEKVLPCTINITVRQRREAFAVVSGEAYLMYDETGLLMRTAETNENAFDLSPNVILEGTENDEDIKTVAEVCEIFKSSTNFSSLRSLVDKIVLYKSRTSVIVEKDRLTFYLRCGISVEINDFSQQTAEKIAKSHKRFKELAGEQILSGRIYTFTNADGEVVATYNPNA
ncbi:MAG: hypothetical protein HDQ88_10030 [Clostridia bacterium]|nr:hypothetical protein [Clostridia bacterium]